MIQMHRLERVSILKRWNTRTIRPCVFQLCTSSSLCTSQKHSGRWSKGTDQEKDKKWGSNGQMAKVSTSTQVSQAQSLPLIWIAKFTLSATKLLLPTSTLSQANITCLQFLTFLSPLPMTHLQPQLLLPTPVSLPASSLYFSCWFWARECFSQNHYLCLTPLRKCLGLSFRNFYICLEMKFRLEKAP